MKFKYNPIIYAALIEKCDAAASQAASHHIAATGPALRQRMKALNEFFVAPSRLHEQRRRNQGTSLLKDLFEKAQRT